MGDKPTADPTDRPDAKPARGDGPIEHKHVKVDKRLVVVNAASSVLARVLNVVVILWMYQHLLARISPEEFAVYPVMMALMAFAPIFFSFFTGGVARYVVEAYAEGDFRRVTAIISSITPLLSFAAIGFFVLGLLFAGVMEHVLTITPSMVEASRWMLIMLVADFALRMAALPFTTGYHVHQRFVELNIIGVLRDLLRIALLLILLLGVGPSVFWVIVATVVAEQVHLWVQVWRSMKMLPEARFERGLIDWGTARSLVSFGLWTTVGRLANVMYVSAATLILNAHGTAVDVTNFHIGATFYRQIQNLIGLAAQPLQPALTAMHALEDKARLARTAVRGGRYGLWVSLIAGAPLAIYAAPFTDLYLGPQFSDAGLVLALFMGLFLVAQPVSLLPMIAVATARVREFNLAAFVSTLACLALTLVLVGWLDSGAIGVALALLIVTALAQLFYFWPLLLRMTGLTATEFASGVLARGLPPAAAGALVWLTLAVIAPPESWLALFVYGGVGALAYFGVLFAFCLDDSEKSAIEAVKTRLIGLKRKVAG